MGQTDGDITGSDARSSEDPELAAAQDTLPVPTMKRRKLKSPTPGSLRARSSTPIQGRGQTPFNLYLVRRSATPTTFRSLTPFIQREEREKTPFELGRGIHIQTICNKAVLDKALVMDISEPEEIQRPVRYITSDLSVIDRAAVMDVSNVEVIYVVEEYEDEYEDEEEEIIEEVKPKKKKGKKGKGRKSVDLSDEGDTEQEDREDSADLEDGDEPAKKGKKKTAAKKKDKKEKEKSPSPVLTLKLEIGGGQKANKKMFEQEQKPGPKPPLKKSKVATQKEEKLKAAAEAAEKEAQAKKEEAERLEQEMREQEELDAELAAEGEILYGEDGEVLQGVVGGELGEENLDGEDDMAIQEYEYEERRVSFVSDDLSKPDPEEEARWQRIAFKEGEEFVELVRNYSIAKRRRAKELGREWKQSDEAQMPHFINFLTDQVVEVGGNLRLACAVDGPQITVQWFKDGHNVRRDAETRITNIDNVVKLEIDNTTFMDAGEYKCIISNSCDMVTTFCMVSIHEDLKNEPELPSFTFIKDYLHGEVVTIECRVRGIPRPLISWWRGPYDITPNNKFSLVEEAHGICKLLIYRPSNQDRGIYTCRAENTCGATEISREIEVARNLRYHGKGTEETTSRSDTQIDNLKITRRPNEPLVPMKQKLQFAAQLRDKIATEGDTVRFGLTLIGPTASLRWMKDDQWIVIGGNIKNFIEEGKSILEISNVDSESAGVYKCVAKNDLSEIETSCSMKVYPAQLDGEEQKPIIVLPLRDVYHSSRNELVLETKIRGNPRPRILWKKNNLAIKRNDRISQIEHLDGICELIINEPTVNDSGVYSCVADNKFGTQNITHKVILNSDQLMPRHSNINAEAAEYDEGTDKPRRKKRDDDDATESGTYERRSRMPEPSLKQMLHFKVNVSNRYVPAGSKVKLQAIVEGPDATMKWLKDNENITYGPRIRNLNRDSLAVLEFLSAEPEDAGTYTVVAQNEHCKIQSSATLKVFQAKGSSDIQPVFIRSLKETYHLNTNELILETAVRGQPTPQIQWFKDSMQVKKAARYQFVQQKDGTCQLIIDDPTQKDSGKYVARAENSAGRTEVLHIVRFAGKAAHIADNIHGVFHADKSLLRPRTEDDFEEEPEVPEAEGEESHVKRKSKKERDEEEEAIANAPDVVKRHEKTISIHFATFLRDLIAVKGAKVKISCFLEAKNPQVKWFKNDEPVQNSPAIKGRHSDGMCMLEIASATLEDAGEYKCWARDETGQASTSCKLEVYANTATDDIPPTFTRTIKETYQCKLNELHLDVSVYGSPKPTIAWFNDTLPIKKSDKFQMMNYPDGTCELIINNPTPKDSGKYVCRADSRAGKKQIAHVVTIKPKLVRPTSPIREYRLPRSIAAELEENEENVEGEDEKHKNEDDEEGTSSRREPPPLPDVRRQVFFRNYLASRTVKAGSTVKWMVNIDGPAPVARWFHGDQQLSFGPKSKMSMQDGIAWLSLDAVTEKDAGEYTLKVKGSDNEIVSSCNLFVYSKGKEQLIPPAFTTGIKETYSITDNEIVLDCRVSGMPRPEIQWLKNRDLIILTERYQQIDQADGYSKLIISKPTDKDSGLYTCVARNEVSESKMTHQMYFGGREQFALEKTHGFFHRDPNKPCFVAPLGNQTVCDGGTIAIAAEFKQTKAPIKVQWYRGDQALTKQPNIDIISDINVHTLIISNATAEVEGTYTCRAANSYDQVEAHATVDVIVEAEKNEQPPLFLSRPDTRMKIQCGDPFSISFKIINDPKTKLTFMKQTEDITKSERVTKEFFRDSIRFTVHKSEPSDSGTYFVVARNNFGTDRIFVNVEVKYPKRKD